MQSAQRRCRRAISALAIAGLLASVVGVATPTAAAPFYLSIWENNRTLGGLTFSDGDVVEYDPDLDTAVLLLSESLFSGGPVEVDALHVFGSGQVALSINENGRSLGGLSFRDGDIALYDPVLDVATLLFSEDLFSGGGVDVDAFHVLPSGNFLLSIKQNGRTLGGLGFGDGDIVEYDPVNDVASIVVPESAFSAGVEVDAVSERDGLVYLSVANNGTRSLGGVSFTDGDIVRYDPLLDVGELFFDESLFSGGGVDIDGVSVPEPSSGALATLGLVGLYALGRGRKLG